MKEGGNSTGENVNGKGMRKRSLQGKRLWGKVREMNSTGVKGWIKE